MYKKITISAMIKIFFIIIQIFILLCKYLFLYIRILYKKSLNFIKYYFNSKIIVRKKIEYNFLQIYSDLKNVINTLKKINQNSDTIRKHKIYDIIKI